MCVNTKLNDNEAPNGNGGLTVADQFIVLVALVDEIKPFVVV